MNCMEDLNDLTNDYFKELFTELKGGDKDVIKDFLRTIPILVNESQNSSLIEPFTQDKIKTEVFGIKKEKSPNLDGFLPRFF